MSRLLTVLRRRTQSYGERLRAIQPATLLAYWPLDDASGTTARDASGASRHAAYKASGEPLLAQPIDSLSAPLFDGTNDYVNCYGASLASVFNGTTGSFSIFVHPASSANVNDATARRIVFFGTGAQNAVYATKSSTGLLQATHKGSNTIWTLNTTAAMDVAWSHLCWTWNTASGGLTMYVNGARVANQPTLGAYVGGVDATTTTLGASSTSGANPWKGYLSRAALWSSVLSVTDVAVVGDRRGFVWFDGDSRTVGGQGGATAYPAQMMAVTSMANKLYGHANIAVSGQTVQQCIDDAATEIDAQRRTALGSKQIVVIFAGVNDAMAGGGSQSMTTIYNRLIAYCQARRAAGFRVVVCTEIDAQSTAANNVSWNTNYLTLNTSIRTNWSTFADGLADLGADSRLQNANDTVYYNADKIHLTTSGYGVVAGIVRPVVEAL